MQQAKISLTLDVDWPLLHEQKKTLFTLLFLKKAPTEEEAKLLDGLIYLLDDIQDEAAKQGVWKFPKDSDEEEE